MKKFSLGAKLWVVASRVALFLGFSALVLCALQVLGAFTPSVPILGFLGSLLIPKMAPWFIVFAVLAAVLSFRHSSLHHARMALVAGILAVFTAVGSAVAFALLVHTAEINGVNVNLAQTLSFASVMKSGTREEVANYSSFEGKPLELIIYRPSGQAEARVAPVLLYIHGGGWVAGTKEDRGKDMRWFADHGWMVFSISYGLSTAQRPMWAETTTQIGCSMAWLASNASRYGGDVSRLSLIGESAGGNLVLNTAYMANSGKLTSSCGGSIPRVEAVIAAYPVVSADAEFYNPDPVLGRFAREMAIDYTGGTPQEFPNRYAAVRSTSYINDAAPPTLIIEGERDHLVPPQATYDFVNQARADGVAVSLIRVPFAEHSFDITEGSVGDQIFRQASLQFLQSHK